MIIFSIAARELRSLFLSPLAWTILAVVQFILAYIFLAQVDVFLQVQPRLAALEGAPGMTELVIVPLFGNAAILLLLVVPLVTMRLISEERKAQTISLLFSSPVSMTEIILGKYLGIMGFLLIMLALITLMPLALLLGGALDGGMLLSGLLGLGLLLASFAAVGLFMSTLTAQPVVAAVSTFGVLLLLWLLDWAGNNSAGNDPSDITGIAGGVFGYLSMLRHYETLLKGMFDSSDVIYYLLLIILFLGLSVHRLNADRMQP